MAQSLQTLAIFVFTAISATIFWFAYDLAADDPDEENVASDTLPGASGRGGSLLSLDVGDPVVVCGQADSGCLEKDLSWMEPESD